MSHKITDKWQKYLRENKKVEEKFSPDDFKDVYNTARMAHVGQTRRDGSEYFSHPSEVRNITAKFYPKDRVAQLAALLHDSLEDAPGSTVSSEEEMEEFIRGSKFTMIGSCLLRLAWGRPDDMSSWQQQELTICKKIDDFGANIDVEY